MICQWCCWFCSLSLSRVYFFDYLSSLKQEKDWIHIFADPMQTTSTDVTKSQVAPKARQYGHQMMAAAWCCGLGYAVDVGLLWLYLEHPGSMIRLAIFRLDRYIYSIIDHDIAIYMQLPSNQLEWWTMMCIIRAMHWNSAAVDGFWGPHQGAACISDQEIAEKEMVVKRENHQEMVDFPLAWLIAEGNFNNGPIPWKSWNNMGAMHEKSYSSSRKKFPGKSWGAPNCKYSYPLVNQHSYGKSLFLMGKSTINGHFP